jgi:hypothetical protein
MSREGGLNVLPGFWVTEPRMDRDRYQGYLAARKAIAAQPLDPFAAEMLDDLAEALLLARDATEGDAARQAVPEALGALVGQHVMTRRTADRFWVHLKACAPSMDWPPRWDRSPVRPPSRAVPG